MQFDTVTTKMDTFYGEAPHMSELRIVLLGYRNAGKRSSGNTILAEQMLHTDNNIQSVKRHGKAAGRPITVVSAPSWEKDKPVEQATELFKHELVLSVSQCPPGPHAFLLIIPTDVSFTEKNRSVLEGYLELFCEKIWNHVIVLFTVGDWLGETTIEQHIEYEGEALQWLVEKCDDRYHVFNNAKRHDRGQVAELLEKIEEMVAENKSLHFEIDRKILQQVEDRRKSKKRAFKRMMVMQKQREGIRSKMGQTNRFSELRLVLLGCTDSGKSSAGNIMFGGEAFESERNAQCVKGQREVAGRKVTVVEAPGWRRCMRVEESPALLKREIVLSTSQCPPGPHAVLLTVRVDSAFKEHDKKLIKGYMALLGDKVWNYTIVLFTHGNLLGDVKIEQHIECEGEALQWLVEKCGNRYHVLSDKNRGFNFEVRDLLEKIEELVEVNNGCCLEIDTKILQEVEERRSKERKRAKERKMKVQKLREDIRSQMGRVGCPSELRILLMGFQGSGKSTVGNALLDSKEFELNKAARNAKREGTVSGRRITVVEASDWRCNNVEESAKLYQMDIQQSVFECFPGPHALLLIIRVDSNYNEMQKQAVAEHLNLLGKSIWSHTMVVFNFAHWLGNISIEQYIESEGKALEWLIEKCENRYHLYNETEGSEPTELLDKIEELVARNGGTHFEIDGKILQDVQDRKKLEERARERQTRVQKRRGLIKANTEQQKCLRASKKHLVGRTRPQIDKRASPTPSNLSTQSDSSFGVPPNFTENNPCNHNSKLARPPQHKARCSVCRNMSTDPVDLPCGHLSCSASSLNTCLQCLEVPTTYPGFVKLARAASPDQNIHQVSSTSPPPQLNDTTAGHVCNFCLGIKMQAVKLCLTCTAYYCELHARQHYTVPALQRHELIDVNIDEEFPALSQCSGDLL